jgi:hypothetical protein
VLIGDVADVRRHRVCVEAIGALLLLLLELELKLQGGDAVGDVYLPNADGILVRQLSPRPLRTREPKLSRGLWRVPGRFQIRVPSRRHGSGQRSFSAAAEEAAAAAVETIPMVQRP